ncbi:MAG: ribosomal protein S18-alanine N-acetyltransferase [Gammaproteobacteria bacterium]|nr:ribosomal protein S18-alanine N-acetyltransferase [Gammaproteobacteria bacterium]
MIRPARRQDLDTLVSIENQSFITDRFSRRSFHYLLTKANAMTLVYEKKQVVIGYVMLLFHTGTSLARLYSLAVRPEYQGKGIGNKLLEAAEQAAQDHDCISLRLEVRRDNSQAINFYKKSGYKQFGKIVKDYYEDHMDALRFEKLLAPQFKPDLVKVPYFQQTLEFTCGPSALLMAMHALDEKVPLDRTQELRLWRESTTIFMTSGHGGCGPYGLALAALHRGFDVEVFVNETGVMFVDSVRSEDKKEVMKLVQDDFLQELSTLPVKIHYGALTVDDLEKHFYNGGIPVVLISSYRIYKEKFPHWVVVTGFDERYIYMHDSFVDEDLNKSVTDVMNMPILRSEFQRMARYGKAGQKAALIIRRKKNK